MGTSASYIASYLPRNIYYRKMATCAEVAKVLITPTGNSLALFKVTTSAYQHV